MKKLERMVVALVLSGLVLAAVAFAAKPAVYSPTLTTSLQSSGTASTGSVPYATPYVISGCGYDASLGGVTVVVHTPEATSWTGRTPDGSGCISVDNFSTQGPGNYTIDAWQHVRNKDVIVASSSFTLS